MRADDAHLLPSSQSGGRSGLSTIHAAQLSHLLRLCVNTAAVTTFVKMTNYRVIMLPQRCQQAVSYFTTS